MPTLFKRSDSNMQIHSGAQFRNGIYIKEKSIVQRIQIIKVKVPEKKGDLIIFDEFVKNLSNALIFYFNCGKMTSLKI